MTQTWEPGIKSEQGDGDTEALSMRVTNRRHRRCSQRETSNWQFYLSIAPLNYM
jgi:hypothetical protein